MFFRLFSEVQSFGEALIKAGLKDPVVVQLSGDDARRLRAIADKYVSNDPRSGEALCAITLAGVTFALDANPRAPEEEASEVRIAAVPAKR